MLHTLQSLNILLLLPLHFAQQSLHFIRFKLFLARSELLRFLIKLQNFQLMRNLFLVDSELSAHPKTFGIALDRITFVLRCAHELILSVTHGLQVSVFISEICHSGLSDISMSPDGAVC